MKTEEWPVRPSLVISRCLGFDSCRYNGQMLHDPLADALGPYVDVITPCPEADIGLGIPRHPVRIVVRDGGQRMVQPATGIDHTGKMREFVEDFLSRLPPVDGFILKSRSPSCGMRDVKQYREDGTSLITGRGSGLFGGEVFRSFPHLAVEDEGRLHNPVIRDHFLKKLFTLADYRRIESDGKAADLVDFQRRNKLLLMACSQKEMRELGRIVAGQKTAGLPGTMKEYGIHLQRAFEKGASCGSNINVLQHAFGYVSGELSPGERAFFLDNLEMYREGRTPLVACLNLLESWIVRFGVEYLGDQTYFRPYPPDLQERYDKERTGNFWK
ncbi:MAG: DUF1722 domain-containing protein [Candidatus Fermentibacteraceae bacterium]|nr:DUF1722 domain-containing protein [Candidatus Fermentibacteraceae bacterium]MBN2608391.1 DUF1722 domain-containing protein [Candidatus Fermentibacteraceae bacterium]